MKKIGVIIGIVAILGLAAVFLIQNKPLTESETMVNLVPAQVQGRVVPPAGVDPTSLKVVSLAGSFRVDAQGEFKAEIREDGVAVLGAMPEGKEFGLIKVLVATDEAAKESIVLDPKSTAVAAVFLTPYFITNDPVQARRVLQAIEQDSKVAELAQVIAEVFSSADPLSELQYQQALAAAIQSVLTSLNN